MSLDPTATVTSLNESVRYSGVVLQPTPMVSSGTNRSDSGTSSSVELS